ncbi:MAG: hypothetical protein CMP81_10470 [Fulvimarina sp.]|nr:hypothetical protein [Fulvimarina sp.]
MDGELHRDARRLQQLDELVELLLALGCGKAVARTGDGGPSGQSGDWLRVLWTGLGGRILIQICVAKIIVAEAKNK